METATIVKLTRTLAIIPITIVLSLLQMRGNQKESGTKSAFSLKKVLPLFIVFFVLASVVTTVLTYLCSGTSLDVINRCFSVLKKLSKFFIVMAMAGIGLNTNPVKLLKTGGKPILLGMCCWVSIAAVSLLVQRLLGL